MGVAVEPEAEAVEEENAVESGAGYAVVGTAEAIFAAEAITQQFLDLVQNNPCDRHDGLAAELLFDVARDRLLAG